MCVVPDCRGGGRGRASGAAQAYIQVQEEEIADDYPLPAQYDKDCGEEMDELLMADEELLGAAVDSDCLPKRTLTNFALYNSEVRLSWWSLRWGRAC